MWPNATPARLALIASLERQFGLLAGPGTRTRVGVGIATGADSVYITGDPDLVEDEHVVPLIVSADTRSGSLEWSGHYLVSPWHPDGRLADLRTRPRLRAYLERHAARLRARHVAMRRPEVWYRTIDRVDPDVLRREKLLFPDMKSSIHPVLEGGLAYPHHSLYFVLSEDWDLTVLGGLLFSKVAQIFIEAYTVKLRGGTLRFQAQYLRQIRVPRPDAISAPMRREFQEAFLLRDAERATRAAMTVYGIEELPA